MKFMKKNKSILLFLFLLPYIFSSCVKEPTISFDKEEYDIGTVKRGEFTEKTITVYNKGKGVLNIKKITTDCHCTVVKKKRISKYPLIVKV